MATEAAFHIIDQDSEKNVDNLFEIVKKSIKDDFTREKIGGVQKIYNDIPSVKEFVQDILKNTNKNCLKKFYSNFVGNAIWYGVPFREKVGEQNDTKIPFILLISPSMRCNLRCTGCYAANYSKKDDIPKEEVDRLIKEARDMGIYYVIILGGETFFNEYMLDIYKKYNDMYFMPFSNGTLFTEELADKLVELGNVMPMLLLKAGRRRQIQEEGKVYIIQ